VANNFDELDNEVSEIFESRAPRAIVRKLADIELEEVTWIWPNFLADRKITIVDGMPGVGKSTLTSEIAARITTGTPFPNGIERKPRDVVFIAVEDGVADTIKPRVAAAGGNEQHAHFIHIEQDGNEITPDLERHLECIKEAIQEIGNVGLLIIDPIMALLGNSVDSYRDQDVRKVTTPLARLALELNLAILIVRHPNKGSSNNALLRGGGSMAFIGSARVGWVIGKHPDNPDIRVLAISKSNIGTMKESLEFQLSNDETYNCARVEWLGSSKLTADNLYEDQNLEEKNSTEDAVDWLTEFLKDSGMDFPTIKREAAKYGITDKSLRRAREKLKIEPKRQGSGSNHTSIWALPSLRPNHSTNALPDVGRSASNGQESGKHDELFPEEPARPSNMWEL
jgi:putative DNA primase/helicase